LFRVPHIPGPQEVGVQQVPALQIPLPAHAQSLGHVLQFSPDWQLPFPHRMNWN
jgi:hypothetical protein